MKYTLTILLVIALSQLAFSQHVTIYRSAHDFETTVNRLDSLIKSKKYICHQVLDYDQTKTKRRKGRNRVFVFEDSELSRNVLNCEPLASLDLPLKILVWDEKGEVYLGYIDPSFMKGRFQMKECGNQLDMLSQMLVRISNECIRS